MSRLVHDDSASGSIARFAVILFATATCVVVLAILDRPCSFVRQYHGPFLAGILLPSFLMALFTVLRGRGWWSAIAYGVGTAIALVTLWVVVTPGVRPPFRRALAAVAIGDMRKLAQEVEAGRTPAIPLDPWCHPYVIEASGMDSTIISYGADGRRGTSSNMLCSPGVTPEFKSDIVLAKGQVCISHEE